MHLRMPKLPDSLPLVSIIVPVYNGERFLRESLDSILAQSYPRIEVLVMDDASTDTTPEIIAGYGKRVRCYRQQQNKRQYQNVNEALEMVGGDYIAVYHSDDVYEPDIVAEEVKFFEQHPEAGAVFCHDIFINAEGREYGRLTIPKELRDLPTLNYSTILNALLTHKNRFFPAPSSMIRASVYKAVGGYRADRFGIASDLEMWLRIARRYAIGILPDYLFRYRHGHGNWTQTYYHVRTEEERHFQILDLYLACGGQELATPQALAAHEAHRAEDRLMVAINYYILGKIEAARTVFGKIKTSQILGSPQVQRTRLLILFWLLKILLRVPRIPFFADTFYRRWHIKTYSA
jgi:glycosyltransferase involved in cell wall biosynthesis